MHGDVLIESTEQRGLAVCRPVVRVADVAKTFGKRAVPFRRGGMTHPVFHDISFELVPGQIMVLRGANGSGKTTLLRILAGLVLPTGGMIERHVPAEEIGLSSGEERSLFWRLSVRQNLEFFGALYSLSRAEAARRADDLLWRLGLAERADDLVQMLSSGQKQRLLVARALMGGPQLILLDEPTGRMDPAAAALVWDVLEEHARQGAAIIVTTHRPEEMDRGDLTATLEAGSLEVAQSAGGSQPATLHAVPTVSRVPSILAILTGALAFLRRDLATARSYPLGLATQFFSAILGSTILFFVGRLIAPNTHFLQSYHANYFTFALLGSMAMTFQFLPLYGFAGAVRGGQVTGTLEALAATPVPFPLLMMGSALWGFILALLDSLIVVAAGIAIFHLQFHHALYGVAILALVLSLPAAVGLALVDVGFVLVFKRGSPSGTLLGHASSVLGGIAYPIAVLPLALQWLGVLLPVTHSANMLRFALAAGDARQALAQSLWLVGLGVVYVATGFLAARGGLRIARVQGSLGQY